MLIMKIFVNTLSAIIEVMIFQSFLSIFGERKNNKTLNMASLVFIVANVTMVMLIKIQPIFIVCSIILIFGFTCAYNINYQKKIIATIFVFVFVIIFEILIGLIMAALSGVTISDLQDNIITYMIGVSVSKMILYGIIRILQYYIKPKKERISKSIILLFILLPTTSIFILYELSEYVRTSIAVSSQIMVFIASVLLIISNLSIFIIFDYVLKQKERSSNKDMQIMQYELEKQHHKNFIDKQKETNKTVHDLKNKLYAIKELMNSDASAAIKEIDTMCDKFNGMTALIITGIESLDALLNAKIIKARAINAHIECNSIMLDNYNFNPIDLCIIMGNLLDNSIEACEKILTEEKDIKVLFIHRDGFLSITIINSISNNSRQVLASKTSKSNELLHGYGIGNVKEAIRKYSGVMNSGIDKDEYKVSIILATEEKINN